MQSMIADARKTRARSAGAGRRPGPSIAPSGVESLGRVTHATIAGAPGGRLGRLFSRLSIPGMPSAMLEVEGWAASAGAGPIERIEVECAGEALPGARVRLGLPSPNVRATMPHLDASEACGFRIEVPLSVADRERIRGEAVLCTPVFGGQPGCILAGLPAPRLSPPSQFDSNFVGAGDFLEISTEFLGHLIHKAGLKPTDDVLDIGCGIGRIAYSIAHYLEPTARYEGFDIVEDFIALARRMIEPTCPNFRFQKVDIFNKMYNWTGTLSSTEFRFPYEDASFDVMFLTSVFTHMLGPEIRHYLDEMARVLRPGGRCLCTCFLMTPESRSLIAEGRSVHPLVHEVGEGFTSNAEVPEDAIGFEEPLLLGWIEERGFKVAGKYYGAWCGRPAKTSFQDILILRK